MAQCCAWFVICAVGGGVVVFAFDPVASASSRAPVQAAASRHTSRSQVHVIQPVTDTWVTHLEGSGAATDMPHYKDDVLMVSRTDVVPTDSAALLWFNVGDVFVEGQEVYSATLALHRYSYCVSPFDADVLFCTTAITENWDATELDGYNTPGHAVECMASAYPVESEKDWVTWDLTTLVTSWERGLENYGVYLAVADARWPMHCTCPFYSMESQLAPMLTIALRPRLTATTTPTRSDICDAPGYGPRVSNSYGRYHRYCYDVASHGVAVGHSLTLGGKASITNTDSGPASDLSAAR